MARFFYNACKPSEMNRRRKKVKLLGPVQLFGTPWTVACQVPLSVDFSRQEYWSGLAFPSPGDLPDPRIELGSPVSSALAGGFFITVPPGKRCGCDLLTKSCPIL